MSTHMSSSAEEPQPSDAIGRAVLVDGTGNPIDISLTDEDIAMLHTSHGTPDIAVPDAA